MTPFMTDDFLLDTPTARRLYHEIACRMPIFDFHCHLSPEEIYGNRVFRNLYELWLEHDHYKWRAMRFAGVDEALITGDAPPYEKFAAWAQVLPNAIGSPLYHWSHLELRRYFGIDTCLCPATARAIWDTANEVIAAQRFSAQSLLARLNVTHLCTTDDIAQGLGGHTRPAGAPPPACKVYPTFRLDGLLEVDSDGFCAYVDKLCVRMGRPAANFAQLQALLLACLCEYSAAGCRTADHGLVTLPGMEVSAQEADVLFCRRLRGEALSPHEADCFRAALLTFLFREYASLGWVAQVHLGSLKNGSSTMLHRFGSAAGCDSMHDTPLAAQANAFLDRLQSEQALPNVLLFNSNPTMNDTLSTLAANFAQAGVAGKIQLGTAWWLLDHKDGIEANLRCFASTGVLAASVGMLTDSRSFLSYTRHEYYRRILCRLLGQWVEAGEYPNDPAQLAHIVRRICYENAMEYFSVARKQEGALLCPR